MNTWPTFMGVAAVPPTLTGPEGQNLDVADSLEQETSVGDVATLPLASFLRALRVIDADANV